ncbi:MAG: hypothetical protein ACFFCS_19500 [Candidatus Hodarchaeota archaeon]
MSYIPKYILKRMVPKDAFMNIDKSGDGKPDAFGFYIVNVISPLAIPAEIPSSPEELAKLAGVDDLNSLLSILVDGEELDFDFNKLELRYEDKGVTFATLADAAGVTIPVGGKIVAIYDYPGGLSVGEHEITIKYGVAGSEGEIGVKRELLEEKACVKYPPEV